MSDSGGARARARALNAASSRLKKDAQLLERQSAMADYDAARKAQLDNMARLRALRLARDASDALCAPAQGQLPARKRRKRKGV
jgi:hypothetical protein